MEGVAHNGTFPVEPANSQAGGGAQTPTTTALEQTAPQNQAPAVPPIGNSEVDALANLGSSVDVDEFSSGTVVQLMKSVIEEGYAEVNSTSLTCDWRNKYIDYLKTGKLPLDPKESRAMRTKATRFSLVEEALFRRTFDDPLARCLGPGETEYTLREVHEGTYGNHSGVESLVRKLIRADYYWTKMEKDAKDFVRK
nr:uncharacterized protein LOC104098424 [Nicotiana tomentosiformis]